ncbi:MAG TPA: DMT family transporter [Symbiobacteriaceae bacterium]|nr:DMT family transporter [Symbiobacteriaceae bacterium]
MQRERAGLWYGFLGVASFSLTLPATRVAVQEIDPLVVTLGRALIAALLAAVLLLATRQERPGRRLWLRLAVVAGGVVLGFPLLTAVAMRSLPASHGAIVLGLLPLFTAGAAAFRGGERPSLRFWLASLAGSSVVVGFGVSLGAGGLQWADLALLGAVLAAAVGYAEGARLAREIGGWQVISWALVLAAPVLFVPAVLLAARHGLSASAQAWAGFAYVGVVSQFLGFIPWYKGLALGGTARVSQLQLLQPFLTILASAALLGEQITLATLLAGLLVVGTVAVGKRG